jgi:hypothetical protein
MYRWLKNIKKRLKKHTKEYNKGAILLDANIKFG